jgi:hypothetical protein
MVSISAAQLSPARLDKPGGGMLHKKPSSTQRIQLSDLRRIEQESSEDGSAQT